MNFAEIKASIAELTSEQRLELAALITHINRQNDSNFQAELSRRMAEMDAGKKGAQADLERLHAELP